MFYVYLKIWLSEINFLFVWSVILSVKVLVSFTACWIQFNQTSLELFDFEVIKKLKIFYNM